MNVAVIGASDKPDRYSFLAVKMLLEKGHQVFPVHPRIKEVLGLKVFATLGAIPEAIDTVTLYVAADVSDKLAPEILQKSPRRIIFNPGAENDSLEDQARRQGILTVKACTLVLLRTGHF